MTASLLFDILGTGLITGGIYALVALGLNLQYGLMRVLNVAHGEFLMLGAYVTYSLHTGWGANPLLTLLVTGPAAFGAGLVLHRLLYARVLGQAEAREAIESRSLLLSFGLLFVLQNAALLVWSADLRGYSYLAIPLRVLGAVFPANRVLAAVVALGLSVGFYVYLRRSLTGKAIRALMDEPEGAQLVGVNLTRLHGVCFGLGVAMAAVTGSLISMLFELTPFVGLPYTVTALVVVEVVHLDLLVVVRPGVEGREDGGGRAGLVLQGRREQRGRPAAGREVHAVEVGERAQGVLGTAAVGLEVERDLPVGVTVRQGRRARIVAQERHVRRDRGQVRDQPAHRDRDPAALARPESHRARRVGQRVRTGRLHGTHPVREHPPVVVVLRGVDAPRHETGVRGRAPHRVRGPATAAPGAALATGVHHEVRPSRGRPQQMLVRQTAPAAVPHELHDHRHRRRHLGGQGEPALHRVPAEARERHVVHPHRGQARVDEFEVGVQIVLAGLREGLRPERVEVLGLDGSAAVLAELFYRKVELGHGGPPL